MTNDSAWPKFHVNLLREVILVAGLKEMPFSLTIQTKHKWQLRDWCLLSQQSEKVSAIIRGNTLTQADKLQAAVKTLIFCQVNTAACIVSKHDVKK